MIKPLKFDDGKDTFSEEAVKLPNSADVKKTVDGILKLEEELANLKADLKQCYDTAHKGGIDRKALKIVVKHKKKAMSVELRQEINELLTKAGEQIVFAFV